MPAVLFLLFPGYIYAVKDKEVYVNLFVANESTLEVAGKKVGLKQSTSYPWNGDIRVAVTPRGISDFAMKSDSGWCRERSYRAICTVMPMAKKLGYTVKVNGKPGREYAGKKVILPFNANGKKGIS